MSQRVLAIGMAALLWSAPAVAQQRGTVEFGGFGSVASFDKSLTLNSAYGGGGRIGVFFDPRWSVEFESGEMRATRTLGRPHQDGRAVDSTRRGRGHRDGNEFHAYVWAQRLGRRQGRAEQLRGPARRCGDGLACQQ